MYKDQHWWVRLTLILWDCFVTVAAFVLAGVWRFDGLSRFLQATNTWELLFVTVLSSIVAFMFARMYEHFVTRGYLRELVYVINYTFWVLFLLSLYVFSTKNNMSLSRLTLLYFVPMAALGMYASHCFIKKCLRLHASSNRGWKMLLLTDAANAEVTCRNVLSNNGWKNKLIGVFMLDGQEAGEQALCGIPQIGREMDVIQFVTRNPVDEVLFSVSEYRYHTETTQALLAELAKTGAVISIRMQLPDLEDFTTSRIEQVGSFAVASFAEREYDYVSIILKRLMDIAGGAVGLVITLAVGLFLAPAILLESPGPLLFRQKRVGRNGRIFTMYKFRSMYRDAEARKRELLERNKMKGLLFKIDDDPRITRVGKFIRRTSLDELPQFLNILLGHMSLVGTRPPTLDEYEHYNNWQKKRLCFRPGLTGIWQTSGRNDITDFEQVMNMDLQYIREWSILLDVKLLAKTVKVVLLGRGAE
ncbi:MAG: sugar transferase [Clostridiales bacterium]|nr:sugar transferase [Clostridiales bacterium]